MSSIETTTPSGRFLALARRHLQQIRDDLPDLIAMGEDMAGLLLAGGGIFAPGVAAYWPSEFGGRAGGLMCLNGRPGNPDDVAFFTCPDPRTWDPPQDETLAELLNGKAHLFVIGGPSDLGPLADHPRFSRFTGGCDWDSGLYAVNGFRPLAGTRGLEEMVRGWGVAGEMIAACTRGGRMPVIWMSVWLEGAAARNASFTYNDMTNLREPGYQPPTVPMEVFHRRRYIPPLAPGYAAGTLLDAAEGYIECLEQQAGRLARIGAWMAEARTNGKRIRATLTGHSYPAMLNLPDHHDYPLEPGPAHSMLGMATPSDFGPGDLLLHLGYGPPMNDDIQALMQRGVRLVHTSPFGLPANVQEHPNFLWFDLPWRIADALVDVPGYSVRILPSSSTAHQIAYNAILCEFAAAMDWPE